MSNQRTSLWLPLVLLALFGSSACDSGGTIPAIEGTGGEVEAGEPTNAGASLAAVPAEFAGRLEDRQRRGERRVKSLCSAVDCSDAQREQLLALRPERGVASRGKGEQMKEARRLLAAAFRGEEFAGGDVERFVEARHAGRPDRIERQVAHAQGVHTILSPAQREKLAQGIESGEEVGHAGRGRKHKRGQARRDDGAGSQGARAAQRLCSKLDCNDTQRVELEALFDAHRAQRRDASAAKGLKGEGRIKRRAMRAESMRAERFDEDRLRAALEEKQSRREDRAHARQGAMAELALAIHEILTPVQRAKLAADIESGRAGLILGRPAKRGRCGEGRRGRGKGAGPDPRG